MTNDLHPRTPVEIAAQLWCLPEHSAKEMDVKFAESIASEIEREQRGTDAWYETARQHCRNEEYYRGLVIEIGKMFGKAAFTSDDGSVQQDVLCAKVPLLVAKLHAALKFCGDMAEEEMPHAKVGTGAEIVLRHIVRRVSETI